MLVGYHMKEQKQAIAIISTVQYCHTARHSIVVNQNAFYTDRDAQLTALRIGVIVIFFINESHKTRQTLSSEAQATKNKK